VLPALRRASARGRGDRAVRPQLVQPRRCRAGDGILHARGAPPVPAAVPDLRAAARRRRDPAAQVLVLGQRRRAGTPVPRAHRGSTAALEAFHARPGIGSPLGGLLAGEGRVVRAHRHLRISLVRGGKRGEAAGAAEHDRAPAGQRAVLRGAAPGGVAATPAGADRIPAPGPPLADLCPGPRGETAAALTRGGASCPAGKACTSTKRSPSRPTLGESPPSAATTVPRWRGTCRSPRNRR